jgi:xanthine dehydrogenase accessory factor
MARGRSANLDESPSLAVLVGLAGKSMPYAKLVTSKVRDNMREFIDPLDRWRAEGLRHVLVRAVNVVGFGAGQYDNALIVNERDERHGTILRGLVDDQMAAAVEPVLAEGVPRMFTVRAATAEAEEVGLSCGGSAQLLVQPSRDFPDELWHQIEAGRPVVLASIIRADGQPGSGVIVAMSDGSTAGTLGSPMLDARATEAGSELLATDRRSKAGLSINGEMLLLDKIVPKTRVIVVGVGEIADALTDLTRALGWGIEVVADDQGAVDIATGLRSADALVVTTHHRQIGPAVLWAALQSEAGYIGALGGRETQASRAETLRELGASHGQIDSIHGPIGLDLGGRNPAETALAICAEILAVRSGRALPGLREGSGSINR